MSSTRPLLSHALSAPRRVLRTRIRIHTRADWSMINNNNNNNNNSWKHSNRFIIGSNTIIARPASHSLSTMYGRCNYFDTNGESSSSCTPAPHHPHTTNTSLLAFRRNSNDVPSRSFASRRRNGPKGNKNKKSSNILSNENLVAELIRNAAVASADKVTVRLVSDEGPDTPSSVRVLTLSEAIVLSLDRELDLIGANITGDPPVIRATQLSKLEYKHLQAQKKQQQSASNKKEKKSFRFKAGIESNDLERKLGRLKDFLSKGHDCEFTVFTRLRTLRQNPNAGAELVEEIAALLSDHGDMKRAPQTNETKSFYRVQYAPKK